MLDKDELKGAEWVQRNGLWGWHGFALGRDFAEGCLPSQCGQIPAFFMDDRSTGSTVNQFLSLRGRHRRAGADGEELHFGPGGLRKLVANSDVDPIDPRWDAEPRWDFTASPLPLPLLFDVLDL